MTPVGLVMAGCWQINSILDNIGRRNSIRILNQYPSLWNISIWTQFICFLRLFVHFETNENAVISFRWSKARSKAGENFRLIRPPAESVPGLKNGYIVLVNSPCGVEVENETALAFPLGSELVGVIGLTPCSAYDIMCDDVYAIEMNRFIAPPCGAFDLRLAVSVPLPIVMGIFVLLWFQSRST